MKWRRRREASSSGDASARVDPADRCTEYFKAGLNCAESVLRGTNEVYRLGLPTAAYRIATPFGAGFGGAKCACGAVTGGLMALGLARGRTDASEPPAQAASAGKELHDRFVARFQSVCCRELTRDYAWDKPERRAACQEYVRFAAGVVASILDAPSQPASEGSGKPR